MIIVTGSAKALGAAVARSLAQAGYDLLLHYRYSQKDLEKVLLDCRQQGVQVHSLAGDFSTRAGMQDFCRACLRYPIQGIVSSVGSYLIAPLRETDATAWHTLLQTNPSCPPKYPRQYGFPWLLRK